MIPVEQTKLSPQEGGNCYAACFASVLECPLESVPHLTPGRGLEEDGEWEVYHERLRVWLAERNLTVLHFPAEGQWKPTGYAILSAKSLRFPEFEHAVVAFNGEVVWDPHPERASGIGAPVSWQIFQVLDPARPHSAP